VRTGWGHTAAARYAWCGVAFGCCFPAGSLLFLWWSGALGDARNLWEAVTLAHRTSALLPVVDSAPLFLGWFASLAGARQDRIARLNASLRAEVAERSQALAALAKGHALLTAVMEGTTDALWVKDAAGAYQLINGAGARALGRTPDTVVGRTDDVLFTPESTAQIRARDARVLATGTPATEETVVTAATGATRAYQTTRAPLADEVGRVVGVIGVSRDVTERRALEERLAHQATHDALTGLANRTLFRDRAALALARVGRHGGAVAVLFADLDDFKMVNDSLGHAEGGPAAHGGGRTAAPRESWLRHGRATRRR
jgi:PAS domain S-box-containing protein